MLLEPFRYHHVFGLFRPMWISIKILATQIFAVILCILRYILVHISCTCYNNIRSVRTSVLSFYIHIYIQIIWVCINLYPPNTCNLFNQKTMFFSSKSDQMKWYECISNSGFNVNCDSHTCTSTNQHSAYILLHSTHVWCMYAYTLYSTRLMVLI